MQYILGHPSLIFTELWNIFSPKQKGGLFDFLEMVAPSKMLQMFHWTQVNRLHLARSLMNKVSFQGKAHCFQAEGSLQPFLKIT